ncbi:MAG: hypothetical protein ACTSYF_10050 [Promethearchaeota archaeon]
MKKVYVIIATGYMPRKTLGVKVSVARKEEEMWEMFEVTDKNTKHPMSTITSDARGSTISMVKNLGRKITHVIQAQKAF